MIVSREHRELTEALVSLGGEKHREAYTSLGEAEFKSKYAPPLHTALGLSPPNLPPYRPWPLPA